MKTSVRRAALGGPVVIALALFSGACTKANTTTTAGQPNSTVTVPEISVSTPTSEKIVVGKSSTTTSGKASTTTTAAVSEGEFGAATMTAFKGKLGEFKALEMKIFFGAQQRAEVQAQDPAKPQNVDSYEFKGGTVSSPTPVKLSGSGTLEENVFDPNTVAFDKLGAMMDQAKTSIGEIEGSKGITHIIIQKNLPFDDDTVVNIYVDGGPRGDGGYVSFKADGTLKKVYGPSNK